MLYLTVPQYILLCYKIKHDACSFRTNANLFSPYELLLVLTPLYHFHHSFIIVTPKVGGLATLVSIH